jgi:hypothetical protein
MKFTGFEFGLFVEECLACAQAATTDERRKHYLDMAKMWTTAANRLEVGDSASQFLRGGDRRSQSKTTVPISRGRASFANLPQYTR